MDVFASLTDRNWCFPLCSVWRNYPAQLHKPFGNKIPWYEKLPTIFSNDAFRLAVANTVRFILVCIPLLLVTSLIFALLIRKILPKGEKLQTACLLPMAIPVASISLLWKALFTQNGILNNLLSFWGVPEISFLDSSAAFGVLVGTYLWRNIGYDMILWLAGLDAIPASMYEAAEVDGANSWQIFWKITLPNLPSTMGLITILMYFEHVQGISGSLPSGRKLPG